VGKEYEDDNGFIYRWVKNAEASTSLTLGQSCCHTFTDGAAALQNVKIPATATLGFLAGLVMATNGIAAGSYGWIMVVGQHNTAKVFASQTTAKTAGINLKTANAVAYLDTDTAMGTAPVYQRSAILIDAVATVTTGAATSARVYINAA
jgi:hypothetical protein